MTYDPAALGARCDICPLRGKVVVPPEKARGKLKLIIVGEGPGYYETVKKRPFVGESGRMVDALLAHNGLPRRNVHVTNAALCRGFDNQVAEAIACCAPRLGRELARLPKDVPVLALGAKVMRPLLGKGAIKRVRGFVWKAPEITDVHVANALRNLQKRRATGDLAKIRAGQLNLSIARGRKRISGRTIFATVHPAFLMRGADHWTPVFRLDFGRAVEWALRGPYPLEDEEPYVETCFPKQARRLLAKMGRTISLDIETNGKNPLRADITCIGVSDSIAPGKGTSLVLAPWNVKLVPVLNEALKVRTTVMHNGKSFDEIACAKHGITFGKTEDTLIAHHAYASHLPQSLAHVGSVYCRLSPWKAKFKDSEKGLANYSIATEDLSRYNAADVRVDVRVWLRMQKDLAPERKVYEQDMKVAEMCADMTRAGIAIDEERRLEVTKILGRQVRRHLKTMRRILRRASFEPSKPVHVRHALYKILKVPVNRDMLTPTGLPAANKVLLEAYATEPTRTGRFCKELLEYRSAKDTRAEYLDGDKFKESIIDGRVHASWKSFGTEVGRPATHGPNILNMPRLVFTDAANAALAAAKSKEEREEILKRLGGHAYEASTRVREIYVAKPGHVFVYFDLSQSQMRQAAHQSGDPNFIRSCKGDVHTENACLLFPTKVELLRKDPKGAGKKFRDITKNIGFAIIFQAEAEKVFFTLQAAGFTDVAMHEIHAILARIHRAYPVYAAYVAKNLALCEKQGYLRSPYAGRIRRMGHQPKPTTVANYPIISGEADCMIERLLEIEAQRPKAWPLVMWAYDAAVYEVPEGEVGRDDKGRPTGPMADLIKKTWDRPIVVPHNRVEFVQPIDLKAGWRLSDL